MTAELTEQLILVVHLLLALSIIGLIMLQQGKGADMGASFGAGASQTLLGSSGSGNVLTRTTAWMVALFFATSFGLAMIAKDKTSGAETFDLPMPTSSAPARLDAGGQAMDDVPGISRGDLPVVEDVEPAMSVGDVQEDLPSL
jgi:preprotein translocase subunit SecG